MSVFRDFFVKEKPVFTGIARGVGGFGFGSGAGDSAPSGPGTATGGTTTTGGSYNYHVYLTSTPAPTRNFTVTGAAMTVGSIATVGMFTPAAPFIGAGALAWSIWGLGQTAVNWYLQPAKR